MNPSIGFLWNSFEELDRCLTSKVWIMGFFVIISLICLAHNEEIFNNNTSLCVGKICDLIRIQWVKVM
uniref:Uncharacterized protein n=1 Tax=Rhizophora mucronata TaxID=61149 RepID=A0A2P2PX40_RHIMU